MAINSRRNGAPHISYGTAFRAPTFNELYFPALFGFAGGNPDLKPETAKNTEAGVNWEQGSHRASAVVYHNQVTDLIEFRPPTSRPVNVSKALAARCHADLRRAFLGVGAGVALDFLDPRNEETAQTKAIGWLAVPSSR
jgi:vitamin B12 transporter